MDSAAFLLLLAQIVGVNLVLSADNAVVIALAARSLPARQQKQAIVGGAAAAVAPRSRELIRARSAAARREPYYDDPDMSMRMRSGMRSTPIFAITRAR